jgi:hypothetical protein
LRVRWKNEKGAFMNFGRAKLCIINRLEMERARIIVVIGSTIFALVKWEKIGGRKK